VPDQVNPPQGAAEPSRSLYPRKTHRDGFFFRLMNIFKRPSHPIDAELVLDNALDQMISEWWEGRFRLSSDRAQRYDIFNEMDTFGLVSGILDVYAEEVTQVDYDKGRSVWIESSDGKIVRLGEECLRNCQVEDRVTPIARRMCKYGDAFQRLIYQSSRGVLGWRLAATRAVSRLEDKYARLIGFRESGQQFRSARKRATSWPWDYIHFRLLGKNEETMYGTSILEAMFRPWRQMTLAEDAVLMYRMRRAPDRNLITIDVGDMEESDALDYVNRWKKRFRKHEFIDPASPEYKKQFNPLTPVEDIFLPTRGAEGNTKIESLSGAGNADEIYDLEYFRNKFFGSAKVPKAYFGFEGEINAKATLMQQDVRFARSAKRIRKAMLYGFRQLLDIHYVLVEETSEEATREQGKEYVVQMAPIAYLDEWERLELVQLRYQIVDAMANLAQSLQIDVKVWAMYVLLNYAKLPEDLVLKLTSKTGEVPEESLTPKQRQRILLEHGPEVLKQVVEPIGTAGFYDLSAEEQMMIAEAIHKSPALRRVIGDIAEYFDDDVREAALQQTDPSLLPPMVKGETLSDDYADDEAAKELKEDLETLDKKDKKAEEEEEE
jgi:hypothetical protein